MISAVDLVNTIYNHHERFNALLKVLPTGTPALTLSTSLSYQSFVFRFLTNDNTAYIESNHLFDGENPTLVNRYFQDSRIESIVDQFVAEIVPHEKYGRLSEITNRYITIAESIASEAYQCTAGDHYSPACFSKIIITVDGITLEQINHMNAKSLAHKNDYSLRNLEFYIPFIEQELVQARVDEEYIGAMRIRFSDRSSANNKSCGDKIRKQIELEQSKFA